MKIGLIINPVSGRNKAIKLLPKILEWRQSRNIDFKLYSTTGPGDATRLARIAGLDGCERLVVLGGDGTLNETARALIGTNVVMGVIPGGSGNDFYKMVMGGGSASQKASFHDALETAFIGDPQTIDVGLINDRPFINSIGIGFDADVARYVANSKIFSGFFIYMLGVFKVWSQFKPITVKISLDRHLVETPITLISVGNGQSSGGGFFLTPQARLDDGLLDACIIEALSKIRMLQHIPKTLNGSHTRLPFVKMFRSKKIVITSKTPFNIHIDGEILPEPITDVEIKLHSKKLRIASCSKPAPPAVDGENK